MTSRKRTRTSFEEINKTKIGYIIDDKLWEMIKELEEKKSVYYNFDKIKEELIKIIENNCEGMMNRCVECGTDMGKCNPRQLCGKTCCYNKFEFDSDSEDEFS